MDIQSLLTSLHQRGEKVLVEAIHKEIKDIFGIKKKIPYPQGVYSIYGKMVVIFGKRFRYE